MSSSGQVCDLCALAHECGNCLFDVKVNVQCLGVHYYTRAYVSLRPITEGSLRVADAQPLRPADPRPGPVCWAVARVHYGAFVPGMCRSSWGLLGSTAADCICLELGSVCSALLTDVTGSGVFRIYGFPSEGRLALLCILCALVWRSAAFPEWLV